MTKTPRADRYQAVLDRLQKLHEPYARHKHPLWRGLMDGKFSKQQVAEFLRQFSIIPLYNHNYHGPLYVICPDPEWREMIAEVVYEEGTGACTPTACPLEALYPNGRGVRHQRQGDVERRLLRGGAGLSRLLPHICSHDFLEGVSAHMLGSEAQVPGASGASRWACRRNSN
jgi:hypothetical protein